MKYIRRAGCAFFLCAAANIPFLYYYKIIPEKGGILFILLFVLGVIFLNIFPAFSNLRLPVRRLRVCADGCELLFYFLLSVTISALGLVIMLPVLFPGNKWVWFADLACVMLVEASVFWCGIIRVYLTSSQLGVKWRTIGLLCGWIPVVHLVVLVKIIRIAMEEWEFESGKMMQAQERKDERLCQTRYPILMVHGVFFRDFKYFNYWGRIPEELEVHGAKIFYGNHQSAASVADSGGELARRIKEIVAETGCQKVNIIAHSKGGLDSRYAISRLGMAEYVASLTTINTPHRGCIFADYLLDKLPQAVKDKVAEGYNAALRKLGDEKPDFIAAVTDLTASACKRFNQNVPDMQGIYYQSVGSKLNVASGGRFPLNFSHQLVKYFDGANDGLVAEGSFPWGKDYTFLTTSGKRGISHGDMIDLNRENIRDFDVREFYVGLVNGLKERGY
ncbi:esterase/lipase family protein [Sporofaciens musculi]|uniref:esterase/lipase family protein n=1 Tax=Sporofaciens musculi TaxID=2681861 RepID=UPI0025872B23|nr:triacylglycerol lipase [Sporofaciens musculi]